MVGKPDFIDLDETVFGAPARPDILSRMVNWQLAKRRGGTAKTKERGEVRATKAKPFAQKGGGRARQGTTVAPQMRGGACGSRTDSPKTPVSGPSPS